MLNGSPLNASPLNGAAATNPAPEPVYVVTGHSDVWRLVVRVAGVDVSDQLTGSIGIDREEGAAGVGGFDLYIADSPVIPTDWKGRPVTLDFVCTTNGITRQERRYTGQITQANWDPVSRVLSCELSDQLQQRVEALPVPAIDSLVGGSWSADVFEPVEGRSHWDYALERLSTRTASLDCSPMGELRVSSWYATAPHFVFGQGTTLYQTVELRQADLDRTVNRVEIEFSYRYNRLWQRNKTYDWISPETDGSTGIGGFCNWRTNSHELPTKDMIAEAAADNSETVVNPQYYSLPMTMSDPCGDGNPWINNFDDLLLGVTWIGARRWAQVVTETYSLTLATDAGIDDASRIVQRASYTVDIENDAAEEWVDEPILGGISGSTDLPDDLRRDQALFVALRSGLVEIVSAHRETTLTFQVPTSLGLGIDLIHTIEIDDQGAKAIGKCRRVVDSFDLSSGQAVTTLSIAVMRGGGVSDPLILPQRLGAQPGGGGGGDINSFVSLPTQLGGRLDSPPYDEELDGFAGNYSSTTAGTEMYPRRMDTLTDEIPAEDRDERLLSAETIYRVGIPNNTLEL